MSPTRFACGAIVAVTAILAFARFAEAQVAAGAPSPTPDSPAVYSGVYASTFRESIFSPCDVPGIGSGWWLRFRNPRDGAFLQYPYASPGRPTLSHFIRVRGRVSVTGNYGLGFQPREIVVDSVLDVKETLQPCPSYEQLPQPWSGIGPTGARVIGAGITNDKGLAAVFDLEGEISIWNTQRGTLVIRFPSGDEGDYSSGSRIPMEFTPDGKRLAVAGSDGIVRVWDPLDGTRIWIFAAPDSMPGAVAGKKRVAPILGVTFNRSGTLLANMAGPRTTIWSMVDGKRIGAHEGKWGGRLLFIGDSSFVASGDSGLMKVYPRLGAAPIWRLKSPVETINVMERSPDGRWLVVKSWRDTAYLWSLSDGRPGQSIVIPPWSAHGAVAFSPDGNTIALSGGANGLYLWDTKSGQPLRSFQKYPWPVERAWFTSDGKSIVTYSMNETVFRIVHLEPMTVDEPVPIRWGGHSPPGATPGTSLGSISGFVKDSAGKGVVGADVLIFDGDRPGSAAVGRTSTNLAGRYLLQGIKVPHVTVLATKRGFATEVRHTHLPAQGIEMDFDLKAAAR